MSDIFHCKLTRRRRSNLIYITVTTLWPRCSSMSDLSHMCKKSKFIQLHFKNSKRFCSFQYIFNKKVMRKSIVSTISMYLHFTLVWRALISERFKGLMNPDLLLYNGMSLKITLTVPLTFNIPLLKLLKPQHNKLS